MSTFHIPEHVDTTIEAPLPEELQVRVAESVERFKARMVELKSSPLSYGMHIDSAAAQIEAARKTLWQGRPSHTCPYCKGEKCKTCNQTGRVKKGAHDRGMEAVGGAR